MDNLIKNLKLIKSIIKDEELIKFDENGQWSLKKAWVKDVKDSTPAKNAATAYPTLFGDPKDFKDQDIKNKRTEAQQNNAIAIQDLHDKMKKYISQEDNEFAEQMQRQIQKHILDADEGTIDFGHLKGLGLPIKDDYIRKHMINAKDLKDIYDNHGGWGAVESILNTHGANGVPSQYHDIQFKNLQVHADAADLMNPGKGSGNKLYDEAHNRVQDLGKKLGRKISWGDPEYKKILEEIEQEIEDGKFNTESNYDHGHGGDDHHNEVHRTWDEIFDTEDPFDQELLWDEHEKAAKERARRLFHKIHKLKD